MTGLSALSTFGDSESEIGSSSYTCQYKLFIRFKDYSYNNVIQYIIHNIINQHYILDATGTHKETRKTKDELEGQLELFYKCRQTWTSGGQWGGPRPNNGHSTAENETELKTNTEVGSSKGYPISELTPSPKDQRSSSKIKGNGMQN